MSTNDEFLNSGLDHLIDEFCQLEMIINDVSRNGKWSFYSNSAISKLPFYTLCKFKKTKVQGFSMGIK